MKHYIVWLLAFWAGSFVSTLARALFMGWCRARAPRSIWCERRVVNEARRRYYGLMNSIPVDHQIVVPLKEGGAVVLGKERHQCHE